MIWLAISLSNDYSKITITTIYYSKKKKDKTKNNFLPIMIYSLQYFVKEFNDLHSEVI